MEHLLLACTLLLGQSPVVQEEGVEPVPATNDWLVLPDDSVGRLWASVGPETEPWPFVRSPKSSIAGGKTTPWTAWADALLASKSADADAAREGRARLLRFACADGRSRDAFAWLEALGAGDPEGIAGSLPYLFPGLPFHTELGNAGRPPVLPAGTHLRPLCPPSSEDAPGNYIAWREAVARQITIGKTTFDLKLKIDGSGVVLDFENVRGGATTALVTLPVPSGWRMKSLFVDWSKRELPDGADPDTLDWSTIAIEIPIEPRDSTFSIFGRVAPLEVNLPSGPAPTAGLPSALDEAGITLLTLPGDERPWASIANAWSRVLDVPIEPHSLGPAERPPSSSIELVGIQIDCRGSNADLLRRSLTSIIEARIRATELKDEVEAGSSAPPSGG